MKRIFGAVLALFVVTAAHANGPVRVGQAIKSKEGVEKVLAAHSNGNDHYSISSFVRSAQCPAASPLCSDDAVVVQGPGGASRILASDVEGATGAIAGGASVVAVALIPEDQGGYPFLSARAFLFDANKKPVAVLKTEAIQMNNLEGAACIGRKLCASSKMEIGFAKSAHGGHPDIVLRHFGTQLNQAATAVVNLNQAYVFTFDAKSGTYVAKR